MTKPICLQCKKSDKVVAVVYGQKVGVNDRYWECERCWYVVGHRRPRKKLLYPNCSELLADFCIHDSKVIFNMIKEMGENHGWMFDPPLSIKALEEMVRAAKENWDNRPEITIVDSKGRTTSLEYGSNGYDDYLAFRLDSGCNDYDSSQYQFFQDAIDDFGAEMKIYDGGHIDGFETWQKRHGKA